jgi:hypothetical protein
VEITSLTRHILEIMLSKFSNIMININKVIGNRSTFLSGGVTLCTQNVKDFYHLSVYRKTIMDDDVGKYSITYISSKEKVHNI